MATLGETALSTTFPGAGGSGALPGTAIVVASNASATWPTSGTGVHVCDGTADQVQVQAAIDALPTGGGEVFLTEGEFNFAAGVRLRDGMTLRGMGYGMSSVASMATLSVGTRIKVASGFPNSTYVLNGERAALDRTLHGVIVRDLTIDGNLVGTSIGGTNFRCSMSQLDQVAIWRMSGHGLRMRGFVVSEGAAGDYDTYDTRITNFLAHSCALDGIHLDDYSTDLHFANVITAESGQDGFYASNCASWQIVNMHSYAAERHGIYLDGAGSRGKFANCKIEGANNHVVRLDSTDRGISDVQFSNCAFLHTGGQTANTFDCFIVNRDSGTFGFHDLHIGDCHFGKYSGANSARYGFNIAYSGLQRLKFVGNKFGSASQYGTAPASFLTPTESIIESNQGYLTENSGATSVADGGTVAHGCAVTPTAVTVTPSVGNEIVSVTAIGATTFTVALKKRVDGTAGTTQTVYWRAKKIYT